MAAPVRSALTVARNGPIAAMGFYNGQFQRFLDVGASTPLGAVPMSWVVVSQYKGRQIASGRVAMAAGDQTAAGGFGIETIFSGAANETRRPWAIDGGGVTRFGPGVTVVPGDVGKMSIDTGAIDGANLEQFANAASMGTTACVGYTPIVAATGFAIGALSGGNGGALGSFISAVLLCIGHKITAAENAVWVPLAQAAMQRGNYLPHPVGATHYWDAADAPSEQDASDDWVDRIGGAIVTRITGPMSSRASKTTLAVRL